MLRLTSKTHFVKMSNTTRIEKQQILNVCCYCADNAELRDPGAAVELGRAVKELRAMETYKTIMFASV